MLLIVANTPLLAETAPDGEAIYNRHCSVCHGDRGDGSSWARNGLNPPPRNFTDPKWHTVLTRERMLNSVTNGRQGTAMMPFKYKLSDRQIAGVVDFIRSRFMHIEPAPEVSATTTDNKQAVVASSPPPYPNGIQADMAWGKQFYQANCYVCHGLKGDGHGPRSKFITPKPRNFLSQESRRRFDRLSLFQAIAHGKVGTVMPAWSTVLSDQQIANVAEYVFQSFIHKKKPLKKSPTNS